MDRALDFAHMTTAGRIIVLCWVVFAVVWIAGAFFTKREVKRGRWGIGWIVLVAALVPMRQPVRWLHVGALLWVYTPWTGLVADMLTVIGLITALWARAVIAGNWSSSVALKEQHELIDRGPYRIVRHPIYSGVLLMVLGTVVLGGQVAGLIAFGLCVAGLAIKAAGEERLLTEHFPTDYPRYRARVKAAIIPFLI